MKIDAKMFFEKYKLVMSILPTTPIEFIRKSAHAIVGKVIEWRFNPELFKESFRRVRSDETILKVEKSHIENQYLKVATALETIVVSGGELVKQCDHLVAIDSGEEGIGKEIDEVRAILDPAMTQVDEGCRGMESFAAHLAKNKQALSKIFNIDERLKRSLDPLKFIQTLFRVECAKHAHDDQEMFISLVKEIEDANRVFAELFPKIRAMIGEVSTRIAEQSEEQRKIIYERRVKIDDVISSVYQTLSDNKERYRMMSEYSDLLNKKTGNVVVAMQCQDAFSQKFEHVEKSLDGAAECVEKLNAYENKEERDAALNDLAQLGTITGAQLNVMKDDLLRSKEEMESNLQSILSEASGFDEKVRCYNDECMTEKERNIGFVQSLRQAFKEVSRLLNDVDEYSTSFLEELTAITEMTQGVSDSMLRLSMEIHLIGLNAQIKAVHVGSGTGLETLSARTSEISRDVSSLSDEIAGDLKAFNSGLREAETDFVRILDTNKEPKRKLAASEGLLDRLDRNSAKSVRIVEDIEATVKTFQRESNIACEASRPREQSLRALADLQASIGELVDQVKDRLERSGSQSGSSEFSERFLQIYTMESEREIHRAALGLGGDANESDDSLDGDILFFDDEDSEELTTVVAGKKEGKKDDPLGDVDLWLD